jgi:hypothetical protein
MRFYSLLLSSTASDYRATPVKQQQSKTKELRRGAKIRRKQKAQTIQKYHPVFYREFYLKKKNSMRFSLVVFMTFPMTDSLFS